jgi:nucleoside-diphosphate-sugar epimerase
MKSNVYNVGSNKMNYTKREVCDAINKQIPDAYFHHADIKEDVDKRNYKVSYDKINKLGFEVQISMDRGIKEIKDSVILLENSLRYRNV